jgi:hypothetical protein
MPGQQQALSTTGPLFSQRQPLPKQLTAAIKSCTSLERLSQLFAAHQALLNPIHIAAMITKLPKLDTSAHNPAAVAAGSGESGWNLSTGQVQQLQLRQLLQQLLLRLKAQGCGEYSPRGVANIVWALAKLQCAPDPELRCMLLDKFCSQLPTAVPQDISNVLWGVAKITKERATSGGCTAAVLQPLGLAAVGSLSSPGSSTSNPTSLAGSAISVQSWGRTGAGLGSVPSLHGSGSYDVALVGAASAPLFAQDQVRLLLQHLCQQLHTASVQTISNSLWAVVVLQQEHQWCMCNCLREFQNLLSAFCRQPHQALPGHIQPVIRCMAQLATTCSNHAGDSWLRWQPPLLQQLLGHLRNQCEQMEMHHVLSVLRDIAQVVCLHLLRKKQLRDQQQQACGMQPSSSAAPASSSSQPQQMNTISGEAEGEEVLARLAASGGPQDTSSTIVALAMLQPQLEQLGLQQGVAALCSMLPPAALPQLGEEASRRLLAATSAAAASGSAAPAATSAAMAAQHLQMVIPEQRQQIGAGMAPAALNTPSALAGSSSASNSSSSNAVIGSGGEGSSSCSTSFSTTGPIVSPQPPQQEEPQSTASPAAAATAATAPPAAPGFTALEGLLVPDAAEAAVAAAAASVALPVAGDSAGSLSSSRSLDQQQQQQGSGPLPAPPQQAPAAASSAAASTAAAAAPPVVVISSPRQPQLQPPPPPLSHQSHGSASAPASAGSSAEPLPTAGSAAAAAATGDDGAVLTSDKEEAAARQLTHNIANADSVYQLAEIFTAHSSVMDMIHITACITRLSKVLGTAPSAASQAAATSLLPMLGSKLLQVLPNANARGIANVLWGYGRLRNLPQSDLLPELLKAFLQQLPTAACRDSAVVLWSLARLTEGQGMAAVNVTQDLLSRLGRQVLEQLSASAAAALDGTSTQQQPPQQHGKHDRNEADPSAPPSSRDVSNSLMALTRLGFVPESAAAAAAAAAADKSTPAAGPAEKSTPAAAAAPAGSQAASPSGAAAAAAAADGDKDQAAATAALDGLTLDAAAAASEEAASKAEPEQPADKQEPAAAAAGSSDSQANEQQQQQLKPLTLPLAPIKVLVQFLLRHAAVAKTLDLQEAATALKQLGLQELTAQVAATICAPAGGPGQHGMFDASGHHHGMGMGPGAQMQYGHSSGMPYYHHHMGPGPGMQHGFSGGGGGVRPGPGSGHMYGGPGLSGRPGSGSYGAAAAAAGMGGDGGVYGSSAATAVLARSQPGPPHSPSVSMPSTINLSGTQLAGLLQQQRRQQPLPMSGPAYGAGWLPGKTSQVQHQQQQVHRQGSAGAACLVPGVDGSGMMSQQQQQQQYRMYMPGGNSGTAGGSPAMRRLSGGAHAGMPYAADASQAGGYMSSPGPAGVGGMHGYMQPNAMQYQQQYQRRQQQQPPHGHQDQWGSQMAGQAVRRLSGAQHAEVAQLQQQQQQGYGMAAGQQQQPGVQYMFMPQQYNTHQQQQQAGTYPVHQQGMQQQQQPDVGVMMQQVLQQQPQQQTVAGQQQMVMVPVSMAPGIFSMGPTVSSLPGQQQQGLAAAPGVVQMQMQPQQVAGQHTDTWIGQGFAGTAQQQQQSQQLMQMLPQIQAAATAAGSMPAGQTLGVQGGAAGVAAAGMPYQVSGGMLVGSTEYVVPVESEVVVGGQMSQMVGSGQLSAEYAAVGLAAPAQQQQQVYGVMPGAGGSMLQQQGARVGLEPPGLYVQQQQQDAMQLMYGMVQQGMPAQQQQQQQQGVVMMGPGAGYAFPGGQYQQQ